MALATISFEYKDGYEARELLKKVLEEMRIEDVAEVISSISFFDKEDREFFVIELEKSLCPKT